MRFQRLIQVPVFLLFLLLLGLAAYPLPAWFDVNIFLRFDPLIALGSMVAARTFVRPLAWALVIMGSALILGRFFCGYICPMGTTLDFSDRIIRGGRRGNGRNTFENAGKFRYLKYFFLAGLAGAALTGISLVFLFSPLSLITRFYALVIHPLALMIVNAFLDVLRPVFPLLGLGRLSFVHYPVPHFNANLFVAVMMVGIFLSALVQPRFWCRNLCPAGAILALLGRKPLFRRHVSEACTGCGRCVCACPMAAIGEDFVTTAQSECITCLKCRDVCPEHAVSFGITGERNVQQPKIDFGRRKVVGAGLAGVAAAALTMTNLG